MKQSTPSPRHPALVRTGDPPDVAIRALVESHGARVLALGLRLCGSREDAEDALQETFLQAYRSWDRFEGKSDAGTWLYTIAARACRRKMRRRSGEPRRVPGFYDLLPFGESSVADVGEGPLDAEIRREASEAVRTALASLPSPFRAAVVLKEVLELPIAEVAQVLGVKEATVKTRVHRGRLLLRQAMLRSLPQRSAPAPSYEKQVCLDLIAAKLDAMDKGRNFPIAQEVLCERCRSVFRELDLAQDACAALGHGRLPEALHRAVLDHLERERQSARHAGGNTEAAGGRSARAARPAKPKRGPARPASRSAGAKSAERQRRED